MPSFLCKKNKTSFVHLGRNPTNPEKKQKQAKKDNTFSKNPIKVKTKKQTDR